MELILDKNFLKNFSLALSSIEKVLFDDFGKFLRKIRGVKIITNYSYQEFEDEVRKSKTPFLESLLTYTNPEIKFDSELDFFSDSGGNSGRDPFCLFFIETDNTDELSGFYGYEYISSKNFNLKWKIYCNDREDLTMKVTTDPELNKEIRFDNWNKLKNFSHPINAIIIFDLYVFGNESNQKIEDNLYPLLENLIPKIPANGKIDIMIITGFNKNVNRIEERHRALEVCLEKKFGKNMFHLSLIEYDKAYKPDNSPSLNFRRIYTNYFMIKSDKSYTYFNPRGKINENTDIVFNFVFYQNMPGFVKNELRDISEYLRRLENSEDQGYVKARTRFFPDKKNRLLDKVAE